MLATPWVVHTNRRVWTNFVVQSSMVNNFDEHLLMSPVCCGPHSPFSLNGGKFSNYSDYSGGCFTTWRWVHTLFHFLYQLKIGSLSCGKYLNWTRNLSTEIKWKMSLTLYDMGRGTTFWKIHYAICVKQNYVMICHNSKFNPQC